MRPLPARARWIAAAAFAVALACPAAPAHAQDYSVSTFPEFASALASAQSSPDDDRILLAAGEYGLYAGATGDSYYGASSGRLEIAGQGDSTVIKCGSGTLNSTLLVLQMASGSSIHDLRLGSSTQQCASSYTLLSVSGASVHDVSFFAPLNATAASVQAGAQASFERVRIDGDGTTGSTGIAALDGASVTVDRLAVHGMTYGLSSTLSAAWNVRDSLIDLGTLSAGSPAGVVLANQAGDAHATADLANVTIAGSGAGASGVRLDTFFDALASPSIGLTMRNSIIAMTGAGAHDLACPPNDYSSSSETVAFDRVAAKPASFDTTACSGLTNTGAVDGSASALALGGDFVPGAGSSAIDAGDPAFVPAEGETDLVGNCRKLGAAVDLGAYETGSCPAPAAGGGAAEALTLKFGKVVGRLRVGRAAKALRKGTRKSKPRIPVSLSAAATVTFKLSVKPARGKKKPKALKGSVKLKLAAGRSYLTWSGKWARKKLKAGKYVLTATAAGLPKPVALALTLRS